MRRILTLTLAALAAPALCSAAVIVSEDFESYADTTALGGVWSLGDGTLDTAAGNPGQSLNHPGTGGSFTGANTNSLSFPSVYPGPGETLIFQADIYDDGNSNNERNTAGLRAAAGANIIEMGHYNSPSHYAIRTVLFGGGSDAVYVAFPNIIDDLGAPVADATSVTGWHTYTAAITDSNVTFTLDLNGDGNINSTIVANVTQNAAFEFDIIRLGGPSDLGSGAGGVKFDNISLTLVPEPTAAVLALVGLAGLARRRG
ncbi:hypothetical protein Pla108_38830 [Botrimarina colliarenosi]|uniref:PEP-CTERM protein-sorting domain-containing protein n=1 Tax=Botrimarina colliarenosi TaxID=2528001 RepID=A0A5C6A1E3_9BACT|nr:hypothetical protein [Botrimarina colliarenosi]TWT93389.1 hypothetical protein Pla108_38830 [Botrimarina colliarenosi]